MTHNTLLKTLLLCTLALVALLGCKKPAVQSSTSPNGITVEKLFEHEGCTGYRFKDSRTVYYVRCANQTTTNYDYSCGKNCTNTETIVTENAHP